MEIELGLEQLLGLRTLRDELQDYDREILIEALVEERRMRLMMERYFETVVEDMGGIVCREEAALPQLPQTEEELVAVFGRVPSDEEFEAYMSEQLNAHFEAARMDVDIEAIALGVED